MARHSHWHNIQVVKGKADAHRAVQFGKLARGITVAAKEGGGDPAMNVRLRVAVEAARAVSMPKDNIERAIARGAGGGAEALLEEVVYEGFAPGHIAAVVVALTDNRARTAANIKMIFSKAGGSIGASGSVAWMFERLGVVRVSSEGISDRVAFELAVIDAGVSDIRSEEEGVMLLALVSAFTDVLKAVESAHGKIVSSGIEYVAKNPERLDAQKEEALEEFLGVLEDDDDVQNVFVNAA